MHKLDDSTTRDVDYLQRVREVYADAAVTPDDRLCCVDSVLRQLPDLVPPRACWR